MRTIRDWYLNAEDGGIESPGFDPDNDDRPDRHVDRWLDRATAATRHRPRGAANTSPRNGWSGLPRQGSMPERPGRIFTARFPGRRTDLSNEFVAAVRKKLADNPTLSAERLAKELLRAGWRNVEAWHVHLATGGRRPATPVQRPARHNAAQEARGDKTHDRHRNAAADHHRNADRVAAPAARDHRPAARPDAGAMFCPACDVRVSPLGRCRCS